MKLPGWAKFVLQAQKTVARPAVLFGTLGVCGVVNVVLGLPASRILPWDHPPLPAHTEPKPPAAAGSRLAVDGGGPTAEMFRARLVRWWPDLLEGLVDLYGPERAPALGERLVDLAEEAYAARSPGLHSRDLERMLAPHWLQDPSMVGYAAYTERFAGNLAGLVDQIPYLRELGVRYLHLMPLLTPRRQMLHDLVLGTLIIRRSPMVQHWRAQAAGA